ncbi:MAG: 50S ribosomal protein L29 [Candidatus Coprovivens sp.]
MKVNEVVKELRKLSDEELTSKISESKKELFDLRLKQSTGSLEQPSKIRELRKNVARMNTILSERKNENGGEK